MLRITALAACATALALPTTSLAGTVQYSGDTLVLTAAPGETNWLTLGGENAGRLSISDSGGVHTFPAGRCEQLDPNYPIQCDAPARVVIDAGDQADRIVVDHMVPAGTVVEIAAGGGDDQVKAIGANTRLTIDGGDGNDELRSEGGGDTLRGGPGADRLEGNGGADVLLGGDGDDTLTGDACDAAAPDVLDGGAGFDTLTDWGQCGPAPDPRPVTVTVNGIADDGRPGEGDDVRDIDRLELYAPATVIATDAANIVNVWAPSDARGTTIDGRGGDDDLRAGSGSETIDGGAGDDRVEGGFGHDTLRGGPGRDQVFGDSTSAQCGGFGQSCTIPFGNDTIDVVDGEVDDVTCGPGTDTVTADPADRVADDCEQVTRTRGTAGAGPAPQAGTGTGAGAGAGPGIALVGRARLRTVLASGLRVRLTGLAPGRAPVSVKVGGRRIARATAKVSAQGRATVRVRFSAAVRRKLAGRRSVTFVIRAGQTEITRTVRR